jgi:hypothetical protein
MSIVFDLGANGAAYLEGVAVFGSNVQSLTIQANATNAWGAPSLSASLDFSVVADTISAVTGNVVKCAGTGVSGQNAHSLAGCYAVLDYAGTPEYHWVLDNVGAYLILDTGGAAIVANSPDVVRVVSRNRSIYFTGTYGPFRFVRVSVPALDTPDGYFEIGSLVVGRFVTFTRPWVREYSQQVSGGIEFLETMGGALDPVKQRKKRRTWELNWVAATEADREMEDLFHLTNSENPATAFALVPDADEWENTYLVRMVGDVKKKHVCLGRFDMTVGLVEVL